MYRQLTTAIPSGQRSTVARRPGPLSEVMTVCLPAGAGAGGSEGRPVSISGTLRKTGLHSTHLELASLSSVALCIGL